MTTRDPLARWLRFVRGRRLDRNPLRRAYDRAETVILAGLLTAFLAGAPFAVLAVGSVTHDAARQLRHEQLATRSQVVATTLETMPSLSQSKGVIFTRPVVEARWAAPNGSAVTGEIPVLLGSPAGTREGVWTTAGGKLIDPPLTDDQVTSLTTLGQVSAATAVVALLALALALTRKELDRRRYAAWDADWQATDSHGRQRK
jgi:hypothetical protein